MLKPTPFWDELGCGGISREGVAPENAEIGGACGEVEHRRERRPTFKENRSVEKFFENLMPQRCEVGSVD